MANHKDSKPQPQGQAKPVPPTFVVVEPEGGTNYFYSNLVQITWTVVDLKIRFAESTKIELPNKNTVTEHAVATLAWSEAKFLMKSLEDAIAGYEEVNGEIKNVTELKLPRGLIPTEIET